MYGPAPTIGIVIMLPAVAVILAMVEGTLCLFGDSFLFKVLRYEASNIYMCVIGFCWYLVAGYITRWIYKFFINVINVSSKPRDK